jgi:hypothetical protein
MAAQASFQAPPGHLSQDEVMILSSMVEFKLTVNAPDADLEAGACCGVSIQAKLSKCSSLLNEQGPCLVTSDGQKIQTTGAIARYGMCLGFVLHRKLLCHPPDSLVNTCSCKRWEYGHALPFG